MHLDWSLFVLCEIVHAHTHLLSNQNQEQKHDAECQSVEMYYLHQLILVLAKKLPLAQQLFVPMSIPIAAC